MPAATSPHVLSVEDYLTTELDSEFRREYVGGYVYPMADSKNIHGMVAATVTGLLGVALRRQRCQTLSCGAKVRIRLPQQTRFYYPDAMVVCDSNAPEETFQDWPDLIAEVITEATRRIDEVEKREAYLTIATLNTYLLVETDAPKIVAHRRTPQGFEAELYEGLEAVIPLDELGIELALADVYERVEFTSHD